MSPPASIAVPAASRSSELDPAAIVVNKSSTISMADGLTASLEGYLLEAIGETYAKRLVSSEPIVIDVVSRSTNGEIEIEREANWKTYHLLRRAFSNEVATPGETSLMDVCWWIVNEWKAQDLELNFHFGLNVQRREKITHWTTQRTPSSSRRICSMSILA